MKPNKKVKKLLLLLVSIIYLLSSLILGIFTECSRSYWEGFGFLTFAAVVAIAIILVWMNDQTTIRDVFFNLPLYCIGTEYFAIVLVIAALHMIIGVLQLKWEFVIQFVVLGIFAINFVLSLIHKTAVIGTEEKVKKKNAFIRSAALKLNAVAAATDDRTLKKSVEALAEEVQFSAPAYGEEISGIENEIMSLCQRIDPNAPSEMEKLLKEIRNKLIYRNEIAKGMRK